MAATDASGMAVVRGRARTVGGRAHPHVPDRADAAPARQRPARPRRRCTA